MAKIRLWDVLVIYRSHEDVTNPGHCRERYLVHNNSLPLLRHICALSSARKQVLHYNTKVYTRTNINLLLRYYRLIVYNIHVKFASRIIAQVCDYLVLYSFLLSTKFWPNSDISCAKDLAVMNVNSSIWVMQYYLNLIEM